MKNRPSNSQKLLHSNIGVIPVFAALFFGALTAQGQRLIAFPGAEGAGKYTSGGRGTAAAPTTVYEVTSLADTNTAGTLRYALSQSVTTVPNRTVVFRVCGTIHLLTQLRIPANTTLAGQTAPGDGICLADRPVTVNGNNVLVRFVRFRMGDRYQNQGMVDGAGSDDAFGGRFNVKTMVDHCTMSWSTDEACSFYQGDSTTLQWNLISEPLDYSYHFEAGDTDFEHHGFGGVWGGRHASFHHNLIAHCKGRMPRFSGSGGLTPAVAGAEMADFRNNVIYDWGSYNTNGGEGGAYNLVNNYYKYGPATSSGSTSGVAIKSMMFYPFFSAALPFPQAYLSGNYVDNYPAVTRNNWLGVAPGSAPRSDTTRIKVTVPFATTPLPTQTAQDAYTAVLAQAGCVLPVRDVLDQRIINDVRNRTGGLIDVQGGYPAHVTPYSVSQAAWPVLSCGTAPADSDHDGMTDAYETANGLNPNNAADRQGVAANGYTNLENYLNGIASVLLTTKAAEGKMGLEAYPNPATAQCLLLHPAVGREASISLYSATGQRVATVACAPGTQQTSLDLHGLAAGRYLVRYTSGATQFAVPLLKE
ncbi:pectate lyase [Hymenobacter segetis]|uniref:T9SS type A sorting domain-containing protein n=1 Tax=Hymenobacter segetis TaxID=2025509 RepID=A0ABU9LR81_9BACT